MTTAICTWSTSRMPSGAGRAGSNRYQRQTTSATLSPPPTATTYTQASSYTCPINVTKWRGTKSSRPRSVARRAPATLAERAGVCWCHTRPSTPLSPLPSARSA